MILHGAIADNAWAYYADQVRRDPTNLYCCSRLLERGYMIMLNGIADGEALLRSAALTVFRGDPFGYATSMSAHYQPIWDFSDEDLNEISEGLDRAGDQDTTNFLRGKLWSDVARGRKDAAVVARRAHEYLVQVSEDAAAREPEYWPALAECYRHIDYKMFTQVFPTALAIRDPEWRAHDLLGGLKDAVKHDDWETYAQWREIWNALPQNAHLCECHVNHVFTYDGLMALHDGNLAAIPGLLQKALEVRGCPHLNSGGPDLDLVKALIKRGVLLDHVDTYLDSSARSFGEHDRLSLVRTQLSAARLASVASPSR